jgi:hypothetical protein
VDHAQFEGVAQNVEDGMKCLFDPTKPHLATSVWISDPEMTECGQYNRAEKSSSPTGTDLHYAAVCGSHTIMNSRVTEHHRACALGALTMSRPHCIVRCDTGMCKWQASLLEGGADPTAPGQARAESDA